MCWISRDPRRWECTISTARAPDAVRTVRTYATARQDRTACLVRTSHDKPAGHRPVSTRITEPWPESGRARGLRCEVRDALERRSHRNEFKAVPEVRRIIEDAEQEFESGPMMTYKAEAAELGRTFDWVRRSVNVRDELAKLSFVSGQAYVAPMLQAAWRQLSGFEHGLGWAVFSGTDREVQADIPGGAQMHLTVNDEACVNAAKSTYFLLISACRLLSRRHLRPRG
jgi:hypothetical protein